MKFNVKFQGAAQLRQSLRRTQGQDLPLGAYMGSGLWLSFQVEHVLFGYNQIRGKVWPSILAALGKPGNAP